MRLALGATARKLIRRCAWVAAALLAAYLVVGNILINTPLGPRLVNQRPERFRMDWGWGLTWWPGSLVLRDVEIAGHARRIAWTAGAARARGRIALWPLSRRELRVPIVRATEVAVELTRTKNPQPRRQPRREPGWTLRFERITTDTLRHLRWTGTREIELAGAGAGHFAFVKRIRGPLEILPTRLAMRQARLAAGNLPLMDDATIDLELRVARHSRGEAPGLKKLLLTTATIAVDGSTPARGISLDEARRLRFEVAPGAAPGRVEGRLRLAEGALQPGGSWTIALPLRWVGPDGETRQSRAELHAAIDQGVALRVRVPPPADGSAAIDADLELATTRLPLDGAWRSLAQELSGTVDLRWHFDSLGWLSPLMARAPWLTLEGAGDVEAALRIERGRLMEGSEIVVPAVDVSAEVLENRITGRARGTTRLEAGPDGLLTRTEMVIERFRIAPGGEADAAYAEGNDLHLDLTSSGNLAEVRESLEASVRFADARVPDLRVYNRYLPGRALRFTGGSGLLSGDLSLDAAGRLASGSLRVVGRDTRLALGDLALSGDLDVDGRLEGASLDERRFDLDGTTIRLANIRATDADGVLGAGWWARVALTDSRVHWGEPLEIHARAEATLRNVGPLLALFTRHRDYPAWVLRTVDAGEARISTRALLQRELLVLDRLEAANERFDLNARLRFAQGPPAGDLYVSWRTLGLGLELRGGRRDFHMVRPARWYRSRPDFLPTAGGR
ncbi:MAG: hypothetical protein ACRD2Z_01980 [Thermoanaerobaculia bacterium]